MKIIAIGHASYDLTFPIEKYPEENTKTRLTESSACGGGPASNAAYLLAKWKEDVFFAGVVGKDYYGDKIREEFEEIGARVTYLEQNKKVSTTLSFVMANIKNGSRTILTMQGKNKKPLTKVSKEKYDVILVDGEEPEASIKVIKRNKNAIKVIDAGRIREGTNILCPLVDYVVCSHDYAEGISGLTYDHKKEILIKMHECLTEKFHNTVVITLEAEGCFTKIGDEYKIIPSIKVKTVDTTGAGDIYHGAFTYFISHGYSLEQTCYLANITGALSVEKVGGRFSMPELKEVLKIGKEHGVI